MGKLTISMAIFHGYFGITRGFQAQGAVDGTGSICARSGSGTWLSPWGHHLLMGISWSYHETTIWSRFSRCLNNNIMIRGNVTFSPTGWYNSWILEIYWINLNHGQQVEVTWLIWGKSLKIYPLILYPLSIIEESSEVKLSTDVQMQQRSSEESEKRGFK